MTGTEPLADLYANHCMDAPAPNAHPRVVTLEVTVTAGLMAPHACPQRRSGQGQLS
jgi:hypothetical protein